MMEKELEDCTLTLLIYYAENRWNGKKCVPIVLSLSREGIQAIDDRSREILTSPLDGIQSAFETKLWTPKLTLTKDREKHVFYMQGTSISPEPSQEQFDAFYSHKQENTLISDTILLGSGWKTGNQLPSTLEVADSFIQYLKQFLDV